MVQWPLFGLSTRKTEHSMKYYSILFNGTLCSCRWEQKQRRALEFCERRIHWIRCVVREHMTAYISLWFNLWCKTTNKIYPPWWYAEYHSVINYGYSRRSRLMIHHLASKKRKIIIDIYVDVLRCCCINVEFYWFHFRSTNWIQFNWISLKVFQTSRSSLWRIVFFDCDALQLVNPVPIL